MGVETKLRLKTLLQEAVSASAYALWRAARASPRPPVCRSTEAPPLPHCVSLAATPARHASKTFARKALQPACQVGLWQAQLFVYPGGAHDPLRCCLCPCADACRSKPLPPSTLGAQPMSGRPRCRSTSHPAAMSLLRCRSGTWYVQQGDSSAVVVSQG